MSTRKCWFRTKEHQMKLGPWLPGTWHQWGQDNESCGEFGPAHFPIAIVEDDQGRVHVVFAEHVAFGAEKPGDES